MLRRLRKDVVGDLLGQVGDAVRVIFSSVLGFRHRTQQQLSPPPRERGSHVAQRSRHVDAVAARGATARATEIANLPPRALDAAADAAPSAQGRGGRLTGSGGRRRARNLQQRARLSTPHAAAVVAAAAR
ncbi:MAG: hypothetical protein MHM6MM_009618, partial [Cercozoa sp. M6MM]